jgi:hypothetical protein
VPTTTSTAVTIRDAVVAAIRAWWEPTGDDCVEAMTLLDVGQPKKLKGRAVYVSYDPQLFTQPEAADRAADVNDYPIYVLVAECYRDQTGIPPVDWVDERVKFFETLLKWLGDQRETGAVKTEFPADLQDCCYPSAQESITGMDEDEIRDRLYWALMVITFRVHE